MHRHLVTTQAIALSVAVMLVAIGCSSRDNLGGPYSANDLRDRVARLGAVANHLNRSTVVELRPGLLAAAMAANRDGPLDYQMYTFVIAQDDQDSRILVAQWNLSTHDLNTGAWERCLGGRAQNAGTRDGTLIDVAGETLKTPRGTDRPAAEATSLCWWRSEKGVVTGLGDLQSKHLILAQGKGQTPATLLSPDRVRDRVRYAGVIIVFEPSCTYWVSADSGTFRPKTGSDDDPFTYLREAAEQIGHAAGTPAVIIWSGDAEEAIGSDDDPTLPGCEPTA